MWGSEDGESGFKRFKGFNGFKGFGRFKRFGRFGFSVLGSEFRVLGSGFAGSVPDCEFDLPVLDSTLAIHLCGHSSGT
jgi:hypothetical protein